MSSRNLHTDDLDYHVFPPSKDEDYGVSRGGDNGRPLPPAVYFAALAAVVVGALIGLLLP
jgi:hypothetical protein